MLEKNPRISKAETQKNKLNPIEYALLLAQSTYCTLSLEGMRGGYDAQMYRESMISMYTDIAEQLNERFDSVDLALKDQTNRPLLEFVSNKVSEPIPIFSRTSNVVSLSEYRSKK